MTDTQTLPGTDQQILAAWEAPVVPKQDRSKRWYIVGGTVVVLCAAYGIITGSWSFTVVVVLCGAMYYLMRDHVPPLKTILITDKGVMLDKTFTRWEDFSGFWFLETPSYTELHFIPVLRRSSDTLIQTGTQNLSDLRVLIGTHIPELTEKKESLLDGLIRIAKL